MAERRPSTKERGRNLAVADRAARRAEARKQLKTAPAAELGVAGIRVRSWSFVAIWALIAVFARYYYWTVRPDSSRPIQEIGAYLLLTDAFHHLQTSLRVPPAPQLLALPDPYDPVANQPYRLHDASLYHRKFYLYFGAAPVVVLYLPYLLIEGEFLPDRLGTWVFGVAAFAMGCFLLKLLLTRWWPRTPKWLFFFLCTCLGFSNTFPFMLRRPAMYETAIACSQFFVLLSLYATARVIFGFKWPMWMAALAGVAAAAAFGSRPPQILVAASLGWLLVAGGLARHDRLRRLGAAAAALIAGLMPLLLYNYVRFQSPFEFGTHYMLSAINVRKTSTFVASRILPNLWFSLAEPFRVSSKFPFVVLAPYPPFPLPKGFELEVVAGIIWLAPLLLALGFARCVFKKMDQSLRAEWACGTATLLALGCAWILVDALFGASMRYQADFAAVLFLASAGVIAGLYHVWQTTPLEKWLMRAVVALGLFGIVVNGAIGITGYYDNLLAEAPGQYQALAEWFSPVSKVLASMGLPAERKPAPQVRLD